jgi:hypothetical protein
MKFEKEEKDVVHNGGNHFPCIPPKGEGSEEGIFGGAEDEVRGESSVEQSAESLYANPQRENELERVGISHVGV